MEGLSAAASVIAVTSLAFQLAESIQKLFDFWDSVQNAPAEIHDIKFELGSLRDVLEQIGHDAQYQLANPSMVLALRLCSEKINVINSLTAEIELGFASSKSLTRKWSALKAALRRGKIEKVQSALGRLKETLILALLNNVGRLNRIRDQHYEHGIQALSRQINDLRLHSLTSQGNEALRSSAHPQSHILSCTQEVNYISDLKNTDVPALRNKDDVQKAFISPHLRTRLRKSIQPSLLGSALSFKRAIRRNERVIETFFGTFRMSSRTSLLIPNHTKGPDSAEEADLSENENIFRLFPPSWLARFGFAYGLSERISRSPLSGPTVTLDVVRSVPDDAVIFNLCREGDLESVQALLNKGQASVKDVDSQGRTPLYFAAESCHVELCKLLIRCGADRDQRIYDDADLPYYNKRDPLFAIAYNFSELTEMSFKPGRVIDTLRLFIDLVDVSNLEDDHWISGVDILRIVSEYHQPDTKGGIMEDVFLWTLEILGPDLWESITEDAFFLLLIWRLNHGQKQMQHLLNLCNHSIDARESEDGYSTMHFVALDGYPTDVLDSAMCSLALGANANLAGFNPEKSPRFETTISLSMYHAEAFVTLQGVLKSAGANFETICNQALETYPLQFSHWTKNTLLELFSADLDLSPLLSCRSFICPYCLRSYSMMVQPYWMRILQSIMSKNRSRSIQDVVETMLSTKPPTAPGGRDDYVEEEAYLHILTQKQNNAKSETRDEHISDFGNEPLLMLSEGDLASEIDMYDGIFINDKDMCVFCWYEWEETGSKPLLNESKCLGCDQSLSSPQCRGYGSGLYCLYCTAKQRRADFAMMQKQRRQPSTKINVDEEEDDYSPYLIHT